MWHKCDHVLVLLANCKMSQNIIAYSSFLAVSELVDVQTDEEI